MGRRKKRGGGEAIRGGKRGGGKTRKSVKKNLLKPSAAEKKQDGGASLYSVEEYLFKVEELVDSFQLDLAVKFCERAQELEPENVKVLDTLAPLLLETGDTERAQELFQLAVKLSPTEGAAKYLYLGQLTTGLEAVTHITRGIEILKRDNDGEVEGADEEVPLQGREELSSAYCALAEIYLTDACFEEDAGERCYDSCCQATLMCPSNPEAHQLMASCLLSQQKPDEAKEALMKSLKLWLPSLKNGGGKEEDREEMATPEEDGSVEMPSYSSRVGVAKLLLELEENDLAFEVLEGLLGEDDEVVGVWYLMGWLHYLLKDADSARFYLEQMQTLYGKLGCDEEDILRHAQDILREIGLPKLEEATEDGMEGLLAEEKEVDRAVGVNERKGRNEAEDGDSSLEEESEDEEYQANFMDVS